MRGAFGIVSLLVALAIVGVLASKQLKSASPVPAAIGGASMPAPTARESAQQIQDKVRDDLSKALEQGAARREEIDK